MKKNSIGNGFLYKELVEVGYPLVFNSCIIWNSVAKK